MLIVSLALILSIVGVLSVSLGDDSRPSEHDRTHNW
jgi:hypothetical protein